MIVYSLRNIFLFPNQNLTSNFSNSVTNIYCMVMDMLAWILCFLLGCEWWSGCLYCVVGVTVYSSQTLHILASKYFSNFLRLCIQFSS